MTIDRIRELDQLGFVWSFWDYNFHIMAAGGGTGGAEYSKDEALLRTIG